MAQPDIDAALYAEYSTGHRIAGFAPRHGITTLAAAYDAQDVLMARIVAEAGTRRLGYKIGLTAPRMQALCGITEPVAGIVRADEVVASPARLAMARYGHLGLEFEIAVRLGADLDAAGEITADHVARAADAVAPAFEIVDDRKLDLAQMDVLSLVAENTWGAGLVLGAFQTDWGDLAAERGTLAIDGRVVDEGFGREVMGHPFAPVAWLANHLRARGQKLLAGEVISTGSIMPVRFPNMGESFTFALATLGTITLELTA